MLGWQWCTLSSLPDVLPSLDTISGVLEAQIKAGRPSTLACSPAPQRKQLLNEHEGKQRGGASREAGRRCCNTDGRRGQSPGRAGGLEGDEQRAAEDGDRQLPRGCLFYRLLPFQYLTWRYFYRSSVVQNCKLVSSSFRFSPLIRWP